MRSPGRLLARLSRLSGGAYLPPTPTWLNCEAKAICGSLNVLCDELDHLHRNASSTSCIRSLFFWNAPSSEQMRFNRRIPVTCTAAPNFTTCATGSSKNFARFAFLCPCCVSWDSKRLGKSTPSEWSIMCLTCSLPVLMDGHKYK